MNQDEELKQIFDLETTEAEVPEVVEDRVPVVAPKSNVELEGKNKGAISSINNKEIIEKNPPIIIAQIVVYLIIGLIKSYFLAP